MSASAAAPASNTTNWVYPGMNSDGVFQGEIKQANTTLCLQLDHTDGDIVREAPCNDDLAEQWDNISTANNRTEFTSPWVAQNEVAAPPQGACLTWPGAGPLKVVACSGSTLQGWGTS
jgi:hypothetical protein